MDFVKAILVDDEQLALEFLKNRIQKVGGVEIIGMYTNPLVAKEAIEKKKVDVVFLDINLPEMSGLELAEEILETKPDLTIVFVTAYDEYAVQAFEINAIDYLVKPVNVERLQDTISRLREYLQIRSKVASKSKDQPLRINVFGQLSIETLQGKSDFIQWRTNKAKELFLYLLHRRGNLVIKSFLIELLWPDMDPERASSLLYTTVYYVRKVLSEYSDHFNIKNNTEGYILETHNIVIDLDQWKGNIRKLPPVSTETIDQYERTMSLYRGAYLKEYDYWWAEADKERYERLWLTKALEIAAFYLQSDNILETKIWYSRICKFQPEVEIAHFALMKIYANEGAPALVHQQMQKMTTYLEEEIGVMPSNEIVEWYEWWEKTV